jgi:S1-C subfamily serine protease
VKKAGLPFEFFQAFARLTKLRDSPSNPTAARLLSKRRKRLDVEGIKDIHVTTPSGGNRVNQAIAAQEMLDKALDKDEAKALKKALILLGSDTEQSANKQQTGSIQKLRMAKRRIKDLGKNPCWLTKESMRVALFGSVNGELQHHISWIMSRGFLIGRETNKAHEFECKYLPSMTPLTKGLYFLPKTMPPNIQRASASTVILKNGDHIGSAVAALHPKYLLTAQHVVSEVTKKGGKKTIPLKITVGDSEISTTAEVIDVPGKGREANPDLAVLYVPNLPDTLKPLRFSTKFRVKKDIFIIGALHQKPPYDLLVTPGKIDTSTTKDNESHLVRITAPALPGNSGGPAVDRDGNIIGIVVKMKHDHDSFFTGSPPYGDLEFQEQMYIVKKGTLIGSKMHSIADWGSNIRTAIEGHKRSAHNSGTGKGVRLE